MEFKKIGLDSISEISPFFQYAPWRTCDFTVGGMFMWRDFYKMEYCIEEDVFYSRLKDATDRYYYNLPLSKNIGESLKKLIVELEAKEDVLRFCTVPEDCIETFYDNSDVKSVVKEYNLADYLYLSEVMCSLSGRKLSGQRNQIHQFIRNNPTWTYIQIENDQIEQVRDFFVNEYHAAPNASPYENEENKKVMEVLDRYDLYGFVGGALLVEGKVIGFSMGEILRDTIYIHIEKSVREIKGAYQMLTNQFLKSHCTNQVIYVNREEDMGDEGLRRSKNAYHPLKVLKKYTVEIHNPFCS